MIDHFEAAPLTNVLALVVDRAIELKSIVEQCRLACYEVDSCKPVSRATGRSLLGRLRDLGEGLMVLDEKVAKLANALQQVHDSLEPCAATSLPRDKDRVSTDGTSGWGN